MHVLVVIAGTNVPSNSETLARAFVEGMKTVPETTVDTVLLRDLSIEHFSLRCYDPDFNDEPDFALLKEKLLAADALVVASPIWNFGVPAHLENVIDRWGAFGLDRETRTLGQWKGLPFFLIFTGGAPWPAWPGVQRRTTGFVPTALQYFGASHCGTHYEPRCMVGKGVFGLVVDKRPESLATLREKGMRFAHITERFVRTGKLPFTRRVVREAYRIGQLIQKKLL